MKRAKYVQLAFTLLLPLVIWISCEQESSKDDKMHGQVVWQALRDYDAEIGLAVFQNRYQPQDFVASLQSDIVSTNRTARALQSVCKTVWFNTNFANWAASMTPGGRPPEGLSLIGCYQRGSNTHVIAITFTNDQPLVLKSPPGQGFHRVDLPAGESVKSSP